jgi:F0F1-type ATP synthase delta subunit
MGTYESMILEQIRDELKRIRELLTPAPREVHISTGLSLTEDQIRELVKLVKAQTNREEVK